jgi:hypothetical protein
MKAQIVNRITSVIVSLSAVSLLILGVLYILKWRPEQFLFWCLSLTISISLLIFLIGRLVRGLMKNFK